MLEKLKFWKKKEKENPVYWMAIVFNNGTELVFNSHDKDDYFHICSWFLNHSSDTYEYKYENGYDYYKWEDIAYIRTQIT